MEWFGIVSHPVNKLYEYQRQAIFIIYVIFLYDSLYVRGIY